LGTRKKKIGIESSPSLSDAADRFAPHCASAGPTQCPRALGPRPPAESYISGERLLEAAERFSGPTPGAIPVTGFRSLGGSPAFAFAPPAPNAGRVRDRARRPETESSEFGRQDSRKRSPGRVPGVFPLPRRPPTLLHDVNDALPAAGPFEKRPFPVHGSRPPPGGRAASACQRLPDNAGPRSHGRVCRGVTPFLAGACTSGITSVLPPPSKRVPAPPRRPRGRCIIFGDGARQRVVFSLGRVCDFYLFATFRHPETG